MLDRRISYSKDKIDIIRRLQHAEDSSGPFARIADALVFAAALGLKRGSRLPLTEPLAEPIRQEVFDRQGYDTMMHLIAIRADPCPEAIADSDDAVNKRAQAFEQYANGGLAILQEELKGSVNVLEGVVLVVAAERRAQSTGSEAFDLAKLMS